MGVVKVGMDGGFVGWFDKGVEDGIGRGEG